MSGVLPSPKLMTGVASVTGRNFRYSSIMPRQRVIRLLILPFHADQHGGLRNKGLTIDFTYRLLHIPLLRHMRLDHHRNRLSFATALLEHRRDADPAAAEFS